MAERSNTGRPCGECERLRGELVRLRRVVAATRILMETEDGDIRRQWHAIEVELETLDAYTGRTS